MTFWVLEDLRCQKWSPTPQYLHAEAGFYAHTGNWFGAVGGGGHLQTPDIHSARQFPTREAAEEFRLTHGQDCGMNTRLWVSREHAMLSEAPPVQQASKGGAEERSDDCEANQ